MRKHKSDKGSTTRYRVEALLISSVFTFLFLYFLSPILFYPAGMRLELIIVLSLVAGVIAFNEGKS